MNGNMPLPIRSGKTSQQSQTVGRVFKQIQAEQGPIVSSGMPQVPQNRGDAEGDQNTEHEGRDPQPLLSVERQSERGHARCQQNETEEIERRV